MKAKLTVKRHDIAGSTTYSEATLTFPDGTSIAGSLETRGDETNPRVTSNSTPWETAAASEMLQDAIWCYGTGVGEYDVVVDNPG